MIIIRFFVFSSILTSLFSCSVKNHITDYRQIVDKETKEVIYLKKGTFKLSESLVFPDNSIVSGYDTHLIISEEIPTAISLINANNIRIQGVTIKHENYLQSQTKQKLEIYNTYNVINIKSSNSISITSVNIVNVPFRAVRIEGGKNITLRNCHFDNIGLPIMNNAMYSADGIFIGGRKRTENISISNCVFSNFGNFQNEKMHYDLDGIHLQSTEPLINVHIDSCLFSSCATRGIKVQSGNNVVVSNSKFQFCGAAVFASMATSVNGLSILNNELIGCKYAFGSNSISSLVLSNLEIRNNVVDNCIHFFRTSGKSDVYKFKIENNHVRDIETCFLIGRFMNGTVKNNVIDKYASAKNRSLDMAILLTEESKNIELSDNMFRGASLSDRKIVNRSTDKNIIIN